MSLWDAHYNYTNADLDDIYEDGKERGKDIARQVAIENMPVIGKGGINDEDDVEERFFEICFEAEETNRQFSPFEFLAKEINDREDAKDAWHEFDQGIADGFEEVWNECTIQVSEVFARNEVKNDLDEFYEKVRIAGNYYRPSEIVEKLDPVKMDQMVNDWADGKGWGILEDD